MMIVLIIHIVFGCIGLSSAILAFAAPKGFFLHRISGKTFAISMFIMGVSGAIVAYLVERPESIISGFIVCYLVITSWGTLLRSPGQTGIFETLALISVLFIASTAGYFGIIILNGAIFPNSEFSAGFYFFQMGLALFFAALDIRVILRGGVSGSQRIARHIWRMCFALFIASTALFLGNPQVFPESVRDSFVLAIPTLTIIALSAYWVIRVLFSSTYASRTYISSKRKNA
ncbi:MAG: hypothetical protein K6L80_11805 [Agarilytica sp.]